MTNYVETTKKWINTFVIQHNLCPFAKKPYLQNTIRYEVYEGMDWEELGIILQNESLFLKNTAKSTIETTILIIPNALNDFNDYLDFLAFANRLIFALGLDGALQIASFHPDYQFDGTTKEDVTNKTNQSPFPLLHLLREESVEHALAHYKEPESIPERNMETMRQLFEDSQ
ncbi:MAG: DUF1415 domain-containing protein [Saprospiraceae bacterium]